MRQLKFPAVFAALAVLAPAGTVFADPVLLDSSPPYIWTDPASGQQIEVVVNRYQGCTTATPFEMTWEWVVTNLDYDPVQTNGLSGWQLRFSQPIPELHNQQSPDLTTGPWDQNAFSGFFPPFGAEWDVKDSVGNGILPGDSGSFSFCTDERVREIGVNDPPASDGLGQGPFGWGHTWLSDVQVNIFNGVNDIPGALEPVLGLACSDSDAICKKVKFFDDDGDGIIEVGEEVEFRVVIVVNNDSGEDWTNVRVKDRFGAEIGVADTDASLGNVSISTKGKSEKVFLDWEIGDLYDGESATLVVNAQTDLNPAGKQEYSESGEYSFNSGAVVKFSDPSGAQQSFNTGEILVQVVYPD